MTELNFKLYFITGNSIVAAGAFLLSHLSPLMGLVIGVIATGVTAVEIAAWKEPVKSK